VVRIYRMWGRPLADGSWLRTSASARTRWGARGRTEVRARAAAVALVQRGHERAARREFSWSRPAALQLAREIGVLTALVRVPRVPLLPGAVASSTRPPADNQACAGESLFQVLDSIDRDRTGRRLAFFLAARHQSTAANVPRPPSASSPARSAADHDQIPCATGLGAGSGRISAGRCALVRVGDAALACAPPKPLGRCRASKPRPCSGPAQPSRACPDTAPASYRGRD